MSNTSKRETIKVAVVAIAVFIAFGLVFHFAPKRSSVAVIDCTWVEISPDFTNEVRQACREARAKNIQKDLQKPK
jgi:hypothetical protein